MHIHGFNEILAAAQEGSERAWTVLVTDLGPRLLRFYEVRRVPDAEALTGEVFADLARNLHGFSGDQSAFRSWVFVIAYRRMSDEWRRRSRRPPETPIDNPPEPRESAPSAEDQAIALIGGEEVHRLLSSLTPNQRDVISLRVIAGLTLRETAAVVGKPVGAVKATQRRAIASLRKEISQQGVSI